MLRFIAILSFFLVITACATQSDKAIDSNRCPVAENAMLGDPICFQRAAERNYEYAILATLAYDELKSQAKGMKRFPMPPGFQKSTFETSSAFDRVTGFQFEIFDRIEDEEVVERIISFRGTDEFWADWISKNLLGSKGQNRAALDLFDEVRTSAEKVSVTGDSLGGALATQVSICHRVHQRLFLNTSPRFLTKLCVDANGLKENKNNTFLFQEAGQFLGITTPFNYSTQFYTKVDCMERQSSFKQHNARALAACITLDATYMSKNATEYVKQNCKLFQEIALEGKFSGGQYDRLKEICGE